MSLSTFYYVLTDPRNPVSSGWLGGGYFVENFHTLGRNTGHLDPSTSFAFLCIAGAFWGLRYPWNCGSMKHYNHTKSHS